MIKLRTFVGRLSTLCVLTLVGVQCGSDSNDGKQSCETGDACTMDSDCQPGTRCSTQQNECVRLFCLADGERCDSDDVCSGKKCSKTVLHENLVCATLPLEGGWECESSAECEEPLGCLLGACFTLSKEGESCLGDEYCEPGLSCPTDCAPEDDCISYQCF